MKSHKTKHMTNIREAAMKRLMQQGDQLDLYKDLDFLTIGATDSIETDPVTGGRKQRKLAQFSLIPSRPLWKIAEVFGFGANKYDSDNWRKSYSWKWSIDSLHRHINLFEQGQDIDDESGLPHLAHAAVHCMFMLEWMETHPETDNRNKYKEFQ